MPRSPDAVSIATQQEAKISRIFRASGQSWSRVNSSKRGGEVCAGC